MVLGGGELLESVREHSLVTNLSRRELESPEGAGFDLRLGKVHRISGEGYLGIEERKTAESVEVMKYDEKKSRVFSLLPGEQVLATTMEKVKMPDDLTANLWARSTLYRSGVILSGGNVAPGYEGELTFTLFNSGKAKVKIEMGARIAHILFFRVEGKTNSYRGQWKGGRVTAHKLEKQV